jgi:aspartyl/asparaginyl beta-hydroxylase (cupin superfamily)
MTKSAIWYSYTASPYKWADSEHGFYPNEDFTWTKLLEENFDQIKEEALAFVASNDFPPYFNKSMTTRKNSWKTKGLLFWGYFFRKNYSHFQETWKVVKQIPGLSAFSVSILEGGSKIKPHVGDTNAIIRVHLPVEVPAGLPQCSFTVKGETKAWKEGVPILFNDAQLHEAQNLSDKRRIIVLLDVIRPEFFAQRYGIYARVINGLVWQGVTQSWPGVRKLPLVLKKLFWSGVRLTARLTLRINHLRWP